MSAIRYKIRIVSGDTAGTFVSSGVYPYPDQVWTKVGDLASYIATHPNYANTHWEIVRYRVKKKPSKTKRALDSARRALVDIAKYTGPSCGYVHIVAVEGLDESDIGDGK